MSFAGFARPALDELQLLPGLDPTGYATRRELLNEHPRAELLRKTGFQVRFQLPLPREVQRPAFSAWCTERWSELLPTHQWLVKHLYLEKLAR